MGRLLAPAQRHQQPHYQDGKASARMRLCRAAGALFGLTAAYGLEGFGYIITGTFLVAAARTTFGSAGAAGVWIVAGMAAIPSALFMVA
jgi:hypothetical protein